MKIKDTKYGDLSGQIYNKKLNLSYEHLDSLIGSPKEINGEFFCSDNELVTLKGSPEIVNGLFYCNNNDYLISLEGRPREINGDFVCKDNNKLKNVKLQVIKYQIKAQKYFTDDGNFTFKQIEKRFEERRKNELIIKEKIKKNKNIDYGLSL